MVCFHDNLYNACIKKFEIKKPITDRWNLRHNPTNNMSIKPYWRNYRTEHITNMFQDLRQRIENTMTTRF